METRLNRNLYTEKGVREAMAAFQDLCTVTLRKEGEVFHLSFRDVDAEIEDTLLDEFHNYALYASVAGKKTWQ